MNRLLGAVYRLLEKNHLYLRVIRFFLFFFISVVMGLSSVLGPGFWIGS